MAKAEAPLTPNFGATKSESPGSPPATPPVSPNVIDDSSTGLEWETMEPWLFPTSSSSNAEPQRAMPVGAPVALRPDDPPQEDVDSDAQAAEDALRLNRALQTRVMRALHQGLPAAQAGNVAQRARVARFLKESGHLPRKKRDPVPRMVSFFSDPMLPGVAPPKNHDATQRALYREKWLSSLGSPGWVKEEDEQLLEELRSQLVEESFRRFYIDRVGSQPQGPEKQLAWQTLCGELKTAALQTLWEEQGCKVDWQRIAKKPHFGVKKIKGNGSSARCVGKLKRSLMKWKRTAEACYTRYVQVLDPRLSHKPFTKQEDLALLQLGTQHRGFNWEQVAQQLPGRSAWMCFSRYQQQLNVNITKREWTPEEDLQLTRLVQRQGGCNNMVAILAQGNDWGRCPDQLRERYLTRLAPGLVKNEWSPEEIKRLNILVQIYGRGNWKEISKHLPGRCPNSIGCRYENIENPSLKRDRGAPLLKGSSAAKAVPWTAQEDAALSEAIEKHGAGNWSRVRDDLPGRTANEVWRRFQNLNSEHMADMYDLLLATKRRMMRTSSYHTRFAAGRPDEPTKAKRLHSEIAASDFRLKISACRQASQRSKKQHAEGEDELADDSKPTMLTTLNPMLDKHLRRINVRRKQEAATTAAAQTLMDEDLDAPVALGGGFAIDDPPRALRGGPSKSSGRISKRLQAERANMEQPAQPSSPQAEAAAEMRRSKKEKKLKKAKKEAHEADTATEKPKKKRRKSTHPKAEGAAQETADVSGSRLASDETPRALAGGRSGKASRSSAEEKAYPAGNFKLVTAEISKRACPGCANTNATYKKLMELTEDALHARSDYSQVSSEAEARDLLDKTPTASIHVTNATRAATDAELMLGGIHTEDFLRTMKKRTASVKGKSEQFFACEAVSAGWAEDTEAAARMGAASLIDCARDVLEGRYANAFVMARPPSHHAVGNADLARNGSPRNLPFGFCHLNSIASAVANLRVSHPELRVCIFDFDVHPGNGNEDTFWDDPHVLTISIHEHDIWPGVKTCSAEYVGGPSAIGSVANFQIPTGSGDSEYYYVVKDDVIPKIKSFAPEIIFIAAGYDALRGDAYGAQELTTDWFGWCIAELMKLAKPLVLNLEGGYTPENVVIAIGRTIDALGGAKPEDFLSCMTIEPPSERSMANNKWVCEEGRQVMEEEKGEADVKKEEVKAEDDVKKEEDVEMADESDSEKEEAVSEETASASAE